MSRPDGLFIYREIEAGVEQRPVFYWAHTSAPMVPVSPEFSLLADCGLWWHEQKAAGRSMEGLEVYTVRRLQLGHYFSGVLNLRWNKDEEEGKP